MEARMTDTGPGTPVDDIIVTGQRARGQSPFAGLQWPSRGGGSGDQQLELGEDEPGGGRGPSDEEQQCATEESRRQWNADARAAEAVDAFRAMAESLNETDLANREFGALLCDMGGGNVVLGPVTPGPPILDENGQPISYPLGRPSMVIPPNGCGTGVVVGSVHSHPSPGSMTPSNDDFNHAQWHIDYNGAAPSFGIYIVTLMPNPLTGIPEEGVSRSQVEDREAANEGSLEPTWINPDAQPCPGGS